MNHLEDTLPCPLDDNLQEGMYIFLKRISLFRVIIEGNAEGACGGGEGPKTE